MVVHERGDLLTKVKATEAELAEARAIGAALALEVNKVDDNLRPAVDWPIVKQLSRRALDHLCTEPPYGVWCEHAGQPGFWHNKKQPFEPLQTTKFEAERVAGILNENQKTRTDSLGWVIRRQVFVLAARKDSTGSGTADAEPRETSADPGPAPSSPEPSWNAVAPGVETTGHLDTVSALVKHHGHVIRSLLLTACQSERNAQQLSRQLELTSALALWQKLLDAERATPGGIGDDSAPGHTCINTTTTLDGSPPPPCAACRADPEKFTAQRLLDVHNLGFGAGELECIPPPPVRNVDPSPWVPEVGDRVLCRQNQIGTIERIAPGASLNIWVKFDNAATCNFQRARASARAAPSATGALRDGGDAASGARRGCR